MWMIGSCRTAGVPMCAWRASTSGMVLISTATRWLLATSGSSNCSRASTSPRLANSGHPPGKALQAGLLRWGESGKPQQIFLRGQSWSRTGYEKPTE